MSAITGYPTRLMMIDDVDSVALMAALYGGDFKESDADDWLREPGQWGIVVENCGDVVGYCLVVRSINGLHIADLLAVSSAAGGAVKSTVALLDHCIDCLGRGDAITTWIHASCCQDGFREVGFKATRYERGVGMFYLEWRQRA